MSEYQSLLWPDSGPIKPGKQTKGPRLHLRGCDYCPQNNVKGIVKIKGKVEGKDIMIWAQSPGAKENAYRKEIDGKLIKGKELVGPAGKWFWARMAEVGLHRSDCDIQNVVRCFPADFVVGGNFKMRDPTEEEVFCCSLYTDQAIVKAKAKVHIILGKIAAKQLLGGKSRAERIFWSDKLNARVVVLTHPPFLIRGYGSASQLREFRMGLQAAARFAEEKAGQFSYLEAQEYEAITTGARARRARDEIIEAARRVRITSDLEDGRVDGKRVGLCYGFSDRPHHAWVFLLDHPEPNVSAGERAEIRGVVRELLENENINKGFHHGSYDVDETAELLECKVRGYDYDTNYAEYFRYPGRRSYALAAIAEARFPDFTGFKEVVMPEAAPKGMTYDQAMRAGKLNFANVPWKRLVLRNAADADLTKRIEISTKKEISLPLLHVYMDAAFTLDRMEKNGPWFDYKQCELLGEIYPVRLKRQKEQLQLMAGDPNFNPGSPPQVADILYKKLKLPLIGEKPDTQHPTLVLLSELHKFPAMIIKYREDLKLESTYRAAFKACADEHKGRLFTKWWLTGTKTGRLSSGGSREGEDFLTVNLQNIVGDPHVENMLVSDTRWRDIYNAGKDEGFAGDWYESFLDYGVYLKFDYSQNELRFLAQSSGDPELIKVFQSGRDIHCEVGHELTGWSVESIEKDREKRTLIKGFHFGMVYGLTVDGMVAHLKRAKVAIPREKIRIDGEWGLETEHQAVARMMAAYFKRYRKVKLFINNKRQEAEDKGYVENILGFRCTIDTSGESKGGYWENLAVNAPIQGGAHQVLLICLALLHRKPKTYNLIHTPESENHDALITRVRLRDLFDAVKLLRRLAEHDVVDVLREDFKLDWQIPLHADIKAGFRYGVMVDLKSDTTMSQFMKSWCVENQKCQRELWAEVRKVRGS